MTVPAESATTKPSSAEKDTETVTNTVVLRDMALSGSVRKTPFKFQMPALDDAAYADYIYKVSEVQ